MFLLLKDLKSRKEKKEELKEKENIVEDVEKSIEEPSIENNEKISKDNKSASKDSKDIKKRKKDNANKKEKKFKIRKKKIKIQDMSFFGILTTLISQLFFLYVILNIFSYLVFPGYQVEGYFKEKNGTYYFETKYNKILKFDYKKFEDLEVGDTVYIVKNDDSTKLSKYPRPFNLSIKGKVAKVNDYYIFINFNIDNTLKSTNTKIYQDTYSTETGLYKVYLKKFFTTYRINEKFFRQTKIETDELIDSTKQTLIEKSKE